MFYFRWLRRFIRRSTKPIPTENAAVWKQRISLGYMLIAWNAFGFVCYMIYTGRNDWADAYGYKTEYEKQLTPAQSFAQILGVEKTKIIRISGFKKVNEEEYLKEDFERKRNMQES